MGISSKIFMLRNVALMLPAKILIDIFKVLFDPALFLNLETRYSYPHSRRSPLVADFSLKKHSKSRSLSDLGRIGYKRAHTEWMVPCSFI